MSPLKIIDTHDGSHSLLNDVLNETYHSTHGALQESQHVFIKNGLHHFLNKSEAKAVSIFEVGFGTGLNALLALQESWAQNLLMKYTTVEAFPVPWELARQLNYPTMVDFPDIERLFRQLHDLPWDEPVMMTPHFSFEKRLETLQDINVGEGIFDLVFFDAFAPAKQPEMWALPVLEKVVRALRPNGIFVTYCAQGQLKRNLKTLGAAVETLAGPPGKREMVRATRNKMPDATK